LVAASSTRASRNTSTRPKPRFSRRAANSFGLPQARQALRDTNTAIVTEGYMDVIALAQNGVGNAVATLGTATTATHVTKLLRQVDRIVFCFDGDNAGRKAAWRALENSLEALADNKRLGFIFLPQDDDPDSYIRAHGKEEFERQVKQAMPLSDFLLRELAQRCDLTSSEGKAQLIYEAKPLLLNCRRRYCACNWSNAWPKPAVSPRAKSSACANLNPTPRRATQNQTRRRRR
jgi:DNA primase